MSNVITLTNSDFEEKVINSKLPVLVDFWAPWCGPCRMMAPVLDQLSITFADKIIIAKLDVENVSHQEIANKYNISSIPNLKLFKNGKITHDYVGYRDLNNMTAELNSALK
ncbi:MAG: thioredoxin 1 [Patescibacteria group bacterium]|jgi:thioredoxin 1|nr:thioredoxin 1 [Patescibacteria group bacterium]